MYTFKNDIKLFGLPLF